MTGACAGLCDLQMAEADACAEVINHDNNRALQHHMAFI